MSTTILSSTKQQEKQNASRQDIINFYDEATEDYSFWSKDLNMHFGYFIFGKTNPFKRDSMLNELNNQLYKRLSLKNQKVIVADLGCGMGGTIRHFLEKTQSFKCLELHFHLFKLRKEPKSDFC